MDDKRTPARCLPELLRDQGRGRPEATAIAAPGRPPLSYGALWQQVQRGSAELARIGVGRNACVAVVLPDGPELAVALATVACSATCAPLNPRLREKELADAFLDIEAHLLVVQEGHGAPARAVAARLGIPVVELVPSIREAAGLFELRGGVGGAAVDRVLAGRSDIALLLHTSGTTSRAKLVPLTHANICASACHVSETLHLTERDLCLNVLPLFHVHGLVGATLSSWIAGATVACPPTFQATRFFAWLDELKPTWYTAVPTMHQAVLERSPGHEDVIERCPLRFVRSSSAALPTTVLADLERLFGVPVVESYGMTEAAHQITSNPLPPRERRPGSVGLPAGPDVAVMDEAGKLVGPGDVGEVVIRGPNVAYRVNPQANNEAFADSWFRTGDLGTFDADGYLTLVGRLKEIINRGGENVAPREIEEVLLESPDIAQAVAFAVPHQRLGEEVAAAIVLRGDARLTENEVRRLVAGRLADFKVPRRVVFLADIPMGPTGKLQRIGLAKELALTGEGSTSEEGELRTTHATLAAQPRSETLDRLLGIWRDVLELDSVGAEDDFFQLGGDSMLAGTVLARVRDSFGVELGFVDLFESPSVAALAEAIDRAGDEVGTQTTSLETASVADLTLVAASSQGRDDELVAVSHGQERLWFLEQLTPGDSAWHRPVIVRLDGPLDVSALDGILSELVRRHAALRTCFPVHGGRPHQLAVPPWKVSLPVEDVSAEDAVARAAQLGCLPFDLHRGPLFRPSLLRVGEEEHLLVLSLHHIVFDAWSERVLLRDFCALLEARAAGRRPDLPVLRLRPSDVARWQRLRLRGPLLQAHLSWWRHQLTGAPPSLELPLDGRRPASVDHRGLQERLLLTPSLFARLAEFCRNERATPFMGLLAAFAALLSRLSGEQDVVIGAPVLGRDRTEFEGLVGMFINMLPLRTSVAGEPSFRELLRRARKAALGAQAHRELPFENLVEELRPRRDLSRPPLFDVVLNFIDRPVEPQRVGTLSVEPLDLENPVAHHSLTLYAGEYDGGLLLRLVVQRALFSRQRARCLLEQLQLVLEQAMANPDRPVRELSLVTRASRDLLPDPSCELPAPVQIPVAAQIAARTAESPESIAVRQGDRSWSYRELHDRANSVAWSLHGRGVGRSDVVAVYGPRAFELVAAMVGVLRSGAVTLLLDVQLPVERLRMLLRECRARWLLPVGRRSGEQWLDELDDMELLDAQGSEEPTATCLPAIGSRDPAHVLFTSGSTGTPKAVLGSQAGLSHFVKWQREAFDITSADRVAQLTSVSFDVFLRDVFLPLTTGATLCIPEGAEHVAPEEVVPFLQREAITVLHAVPTLVREWLAVSPDNGTLEAMRYVFFAGEPLSEELVGAWRARCPGGSRIVNLYGPTETTLAKCAWRVPDEPAPGVQPVGEAMPGAQALVLNAEGRPCGVGEPGEVVLRSPFRSLGYLGDPELTAKRFVCNPFREDEDDLLYFTGDRGRFRPDGLLEVLGRLDDQLKIHGVRIEPAEVSAAILSHDAVRSCYVGARRDADGRSLLVAWVTPRRNREIVVPDLRRDLAERLPAALVPSSVVVLAELPRTATGKVDPKSLPDPMLASAVEPGADPAPLSPTERVIGQAWCDVLGLGEVSRGDNFFDLGGHSLASMRVVHRLREELGVQLNPRELVYQSLGQLAASCDEQAGTRRPAETGLVSRLALSLREVVGRVFP